MALRSQPAGPCWRGLSRYVLLLGAGMAVGCSREPSAEVEVEVSRVALDPASRSPVVLLEDKGHTVALPIWIGPAEANAIASQLQGLDSPRPLTHDLMKTVMEQVGVALQRVVIRELRDNTYYASLVLLWDGKEMEIDSRPSDAIALAVRFGQPIFVHRALLEGQAAVDLRSRRADASVEVGGLTVQVLSDELADYFDLPAGQGVLVSDISNGAADGLRRGDVILEVDGDPVHDPADFRAKLRAGDGSVDLAVQREHLRIHVAFAAPARPEVD
jgi:bifunctional DNase/RNase